MKLGRVSLIFLLLLVPATILAVVPLFDTWLSFNAQLRPQGIRAADMDGDGDLDLVVANFTSNSVTVLKNAGDGTFSDTSSFPCGGGPVDVAIADFDADGDLDIVGVNFGGSNFSVIKNNGDATFSPGVNCFVKEGGGGGPRSIITADFNNDGRPDLATANYNDSDVSVSLNLGRAVFPPECKDNFFSGPRPTQVVPFNFDGDNLIDLASSDSGGHTISIFRNNGGGQFLFRRDTVLSTLTPATPVTSDSGPVSLAAGDLDGDGDDDLVSVSAKGGGISFFKNGGNGRFVPIGAAGRARRVLPAGSRPARVILSDTDGDGDLDLIVSNFQTGTVSVYRNIGTGLNSPFTNFPDSSRRDIIVKPGPLGLVAADLDGDGDRDLGITHPLARLPDPNGTGTIFGQSVLVVLNRGNGTFAAGTLLPAPAIALIQPQAAIPVNVDGDADLDVAMVNLDQDNTGNQLSIFKNSGGGTFGAPVNFSTVNPNPSSLSAADFDGDGDFDLAAACQGNNRISIMRNDGSGAFAFAASLQSGTNPRSMRSADLDGDGDADLVNTSFFALDSLIFHFNDGTGAFPVRTSISSARNPLFICPADLDGDNDVDLAVVNQGISSPGSESTQTVSVFTNNGNGTFGPRADYRPGVSPSGCFAGDLDGDGDLDLAVSNAGTAIVTDNSVSIFKNNGNASYQPQVKFPAGNSPAAVTGADFDADGNVDLVTADLGGNTLSFLKGAGGAAFDPPLAYGGGRNPRFVSQADIDGDGDVDLLVTTDDGCLLLKNQTNPNFSGAPGDVNRDGVLNLVDVMLAINCIFLGIGDPLSRSRCDVSCDQLGTSADVVLLINAHFLKIPLPTCP